MRYVLLLTALLNLAAAQELPLEPFSYHESFENGQDPVKFWVSNGDYQVNFKGVTDEAAADGQRSFKLDVTLGSGTYYYWSVPVDAIAEGELTFSAKIRIAEGNTADAGIGLNWIYPPTRHTGCGPFESYRQPGDEWHTIAADVAAVSPDRALGVLHGYVDGAEVDNIGLRVDRWGIFIRGKAGQRAVIYIDDVRLEGRVPNQEAYQAAVAERWRPYTEAWATRVEDWRRRVADTAARMAELPELPADLAPAVEGTQNALNRTREQVETMAKDGYARPQEVDELEGNLRMAELAPTTLGRIAEAAAAGQPFVALPVRAISNARILPGELAVPVLPGEGLTLSACRGERETASFVVLALEDLKGLTVEAAPLTAEGGPAIPAAAVDLKLVKVWYQAGRGISDLRNKLLVPELLLNDDALVRVDEQAEQNYLRSAAADGTTSYRLASDAESAELEGVRPIDAKTLQPLDLAARRLQQYWVTIQVPSDAAAGEYRGELQVRTGARSVMLPIQLTVHDFELAPSPLIYSIYYRAKLAENNEPTITSEMRSEEQYLAEMRDMEAHGVLYPTLYQGYHETLLPRALELRAQAGLPTEHLFTLGVSTGSPQDEAALQSLRGKVRDWLAMAKRFGYERTYVYGIDEASGERLAAQRAAWRAVQEEGAKTFVACYRGTFEAMGDLLDVAVLAHRPDPAEAAKFHGVGSQAFCYANPQVGPEEPETFRRNFGLLLWKSDYDGAMDYAYQHGFGHVWNDFDSHQYRDHNFTYPTIDGVVDTVQWAGFREAVDDTRYLATLLNAIEQCADPATAAAAREWVAALDPAADLEELRAEMVRRIEMCRQGR